MSGGKGYVVGCTEPVTVSLTARPVSNAGLGIGYNYISLPTSLPASLRTAENILRKVSNSNVQCTEVSRWAYRAPGSGEEAYWYSHQRWSAENNFQLQE